MYFNCIVLLYRSVIGMYVYMYVVVSFLLMKQLFGPSVCVSIHICYRKGCNAVILCIYACIMYVSTYSFFSVVRRIYTIVEVNVNAQNTYIICTIYTGVLFSQKIAGGKTLLFRLQVLSVCKDRLDEYYIYLSYVYTLLYIYIVRVFPKSPIALERCVKLCTLYMHVYLVLYVQQLDELILAR